MLNTTSPTFVPSAPNAFPCHTDPSSKTNLQGFWTSHGFEIAPPPAKHFKVAFLPPPLEEEEEVEHDDEADEEVFPTRPLNDDDNCWCCAQDDDMFVFQTSFFVFLRKRKRIQKLTTWCRRGLFLCFFVSVGFCGSGNVLPPHIYFVVQRAKKDIFLLLQQHQEQQQQYSYALKARRDNNFLLKHATDDARRRKFSNDDDVERAREQ